ncbi:acyl-CoA thioesterase [Aquisalimonas asiatica]|uniref:Acyl-CoA thioesterase n=1 Tax=Aquisalimonas asiatica TaxID=406100 RepID=A0A1H8Q5I2_9GAMM|nr:thioesterase family protein [Aquisalimonas asiatica]SEO49278.1 Acyl-CoA thioesterase [Aquisalimonas asiatica]
MTFSQTLADLRASGNDTVTVSADWAQGRALFGGLAGALALDPMVRSVAPDRVLRSVSISFVGPIAPGGVSVESRLLREGGSVSQCQSEVVQEGAVRTAAMASFGVPRSSSVNMPAVAAPDVEAPESLDVMPFQEGVSPAFTRHFEYCYGIGSLPFSGANTRRMGGWVRFRDEQDPITPMHLLGLIDAWPPATLPLLEERAPSSSLTWYAEIIHPVPGIRSGDWVLYEAELDYARDGYGQTHARLWNRQGDLIAISRQTVTVFA